jgi:hypothetical protein
MDPVFSFRPGAQKARQPGTYMTVAFVLVVFIAGMLLGSFMQHSSEQKEGQQALYKLAVSLANPKQQQQGPTALPHVLGAEGKTVFASDLSSLSRLDALIRAQQLNTSGCQPAEFGQGWGNHRLCTKNTPPNPCHFYSFGK